MQYASLFIYFKYRDREIIATVIQTGGMCEIATLRGTLRGAPAEMLKCPGHWLKLKSPRAAE